MRNDRRSPSWRSARGTPSTATRNHTNAAAFLHMGDDRRLAHARRVERIPDVVDHGDGGAVGLLGVFITTRVGYAEGDATSYPFRATSRRMGRGRSWAVSKRRVITRPSRAPKAPRPPCSTGSTSKSPIRSSVCAYSARPQTSPPCPITAPAQGDRSRGGNRCQRRLREIRPSAAGLHDGPRASGPPSRSRGRRTGPRRASDSPFPGSRPDRRAPRSGT